MEQLLAITLTGCRGLFPRRLLHRWTPLTTIVVAALISQIIAAETLDAKDNQRPNIIFIMADDNSQ